MVVMESLTGTLVNKEEVTPELTKQSSGPRSNPNISNFALHSGRGSICYKCLKLCSSNVFFAGLASYPVCYAYCLESILPYFYFHFGWIGVLFCCYFDLRRDQATLQKIKLSLKCRQ